MPHSSERYKNFLTSYDFFPNSIAFRIHSSKALEKWKNVQSFQLNQVVNGKYYFPQDRREILLLGYDLWSRFLYEIENLCIEMSGDHLDMITNEKDIELISILAEKNIKKYYEIVETEAVFNDDFSHIWAKQHKFADDIMLKEIKSFKGLSFDQLFTALVDTCVDVLQYTLIELYEIHMMKCWSKTALKSCGTCNHDILCNVTTETPFVVISHLSTMAFKKYDICLVSKRLTVYKELFNIQEIFLKNYTNQIIDEKLFESIEKVGITIDYRQSTQYA